MSSDQTFQLIFPEIVNIGCIFECRYMTFYSTTAFWGTWQFSSPHLFIIQFKMMHQCWIKTIVICRLRFYYIWNKCQCNKNAIFLIPCTYCPWHDSALKKFIEIENGVHIVGKPDAFYSIWLVKKSTEWRINVLQAEGLCATNQSQGKFNQKLNI